MGSLTVVAMLCLAPVPKGEGKPTYEVILARCISTTLGENLSVESVLEIVEGGHPKNLVGSRVVIRYTNGNAEVIRPLLSDRLVLQPMQPGSRSYLIVKHTKDDKMSA